MATNRFGLTILPEEQLNISDRLMEKYPGKAWLVYEEDGVGLVCYYVLQCNNPSKVAARHILNDNPRIQKVYMTLRDYVSYDLIEDLTRGRKVKMFDRHEMSENNKSK